MLGVFPIRGSLLIVVLALAACDTPAQQEVRRIESESQRVEALVKPCFERALASPSALALKDKLIPYDLNTPVPLTLLADDTKPTPEQVQAIFALHAEYQPCRKLALENLGSINPGLVAIFAEHYARQDEQAVQLTKGALTWGENAKAAQRLRQETTHKLVALWQQMNQQLAASHAAEIERRQRAGQALLMWGVYQQQLNQQQQMINAMSRPVVTNCSYVGRQIQCRSF